MKTNIRFPNQTRVRATPTIWEELHGAGIRHLPDKPEYFYVAYDFESALKPFRKCKGNSTELTHVHMPISVGLYTESIPDSPIQGEYLESTGDLNDLIERFYDICERLSDSAYELKKKKYKKIYKQLTTRIANAKKRLDAIQDEKLRAQFQRYYDSACQLLDKFDAKMLLLDICGYNSNAYDLGLIVSTLVRVLDRRQPFEVSRPGRKVENSQGFTPSPQEPRRRRQGTGCVDPLANTEPEIDSFSFAIKKTAGKFVTFQTRKLRFVDIREFVAGGSLKTFLECFSDDQEEEEKLYFPYELVQSVDDLAREGFPSYDSFYSTLKEANTLEDGTNDKTVGMANYAKLHDLWVKEGMVTLGDLLQAYQMCDVRPFYRAISRMIEMYAGMGIWVLDHMTLPSLAFNYAIKTTNGAFHTVPAYLEEWYHLLVANILGGFSSLLHQPYAEVGVTPIAPDIWGSAALITKAIECYDFNALYPWVMLQALPTGRPMARYFPDFKLVTHETRLANSSLGIQYARWLSHSRGTDCAHAGNGREIIISGRFPVDCYEIKTNTCFDFHGCYWHYHENCPLNPFGIDSPEARERHAKDAEKAEFIRSEGYQYFVKYQCDYEREKQSNPALQDFLASDALLAEESMDEDPNQESCFSEEEESAGIDQKLILEKVASGDFFGFLLLDCHIKPAHENDYERYPIIIRRETITREMLSERQRNVAAKHKILQRPTSTVIGAKSAESLLVISDQVKFWLSLGTVEITRIYQVVEYQPRKCLANCIDNLTHLRRAGDKDPSKKVLGNMAKLIANSIYGRSLLRRDLFTKYVLCNREDSKYLMTKAQFRSIQPLLTPDEIIERVEEAPVETHYDPNMIFQVNMAQKTVYADNPVVFGSYVLAKAKLRNMQVMEVFREFLDPKSYTTAYSDTDSIFLILGHETLDECVIESKRLEWFSSVRSLWFIQEHCERHRADYTHVKMAREPWIMPECCRNVNLWFLREPGILKSEYSATRFNALNPKTYILENTKNNTFKKSHKGVQARAATTLDWEAFNKTRNQGECVNITNTGFCQWDGVTVTYKQTKRGLNPINTKRLENPNFPYNTNTLV